VSVRDTLPDDAPDALPRPATGSLVPDDPHLLRGVALLRGGQWFEAHEVLELRWKLTPRDSADRHLLQAMIQYAVSLEHGRRGNPDAARGQREKAARHLRAVLATVRALGPVHAEACP